MLRKERTAAIGNNVANVRLLEKGCKMDELKSYISQIIDAQPLKVVISKPLVKDEQYKKIVIERKSSFYQLSKYTEKQVFHENIPFNEICKKCTTIVYQHYLQLNAWSYEREFILLISKKGKITFKINTLKLTNIRTAESKHNRKKNYILEEGNLIEPLIDMGIFTKDGKIVNSMYDKYKQINRFIEIIDDAIKDSNFTHLNIIDFGCGKSYLTFIVYYYLTVIRQINVNMIGLDLKADVIEKCNAAARKYYYQNLSFELGDIKGFNCPFDVDMVITLHACDTATDFALYNAIKWKAQMIFSVPCCQHEFNKQIRPKSLSLLSHYGIIQERFSALATDAIRGNLLEFSGYKTQLLEFIDFEHTPKNILIRAVRRPIVSYSAQKRALAEVETVIREFNAEPTLYKLLIDKEYKISDF